MKSVQLEFMEARGEEIKAKSDSQKVQESINQTFEEMFEMLRQIAKTRKRREEWIHDQAENKEEDRTLLIKIHKMNYIISLDVLDQVFAEFGGIDYMEVFSSGGKYHSKIRFQNTNSAIRAFDSLNHRYIYEGGCQLELFRMEDIESSKPEAVGKQEIGNDALKLAFSGTSDKVESPVDDLSEEIDSSKIEAPIEALRQDFEFEAISESSMTTPQVLVDGSEAMTVEIYALEDESVKGSVEPYSANEISKSSVALNPFECESSNSLIVCMPISTVQLGLESNSLSGVLEFPKRYASKVFAKMTDEKVASFESKMIVGQSIFGGILDCGRKCCYLAVAKGMNLVFDPGGHCLRIVK